MKKLLFLLILAVFVASGCGKDSSNDKENSQSKTKTTQAATSEGQDSGNKSALKLIKKVDQLGNQPIPSLDGYDSSFHIFQKDGYTYVVQVKQQDVASELFSPESLAFSVDVSVLKDNKWIVKNKETNLIDQVWNTRNEDAKTWNSNITYTDSAMYVVTKTDYRGTGTTALQPINQVHKLTFGPDGVAHYTKLLDKPETTEGDFNYGIVSSFGKAYIYENISDSNTSLDKYNILSEDGKFVTTITNSDTTYFSGHSEISMMTQDNLYFGNMKHVQSYNLKKKDLYWNADGSKLDFPFAAGLYQSFVPVKNGAYLVTHAKGNFYLSYTQLNSDGTATILATIDIPASLEIQNAYISADSKNVNVYAVVEYKGQPTIQKYTYSRIDK